MARIIFCLMYAGAYMQKSCSNLRRDQASKLTKFCPDVITSYSSKFGVTVISNEIVFLQVYISTVYGNFLLSKFVAASNLSYICYQNIERSWKWGHFTSFSLALALETASEKQILSFSNYSQSFTLHCCLPRKRQSQKLYRPECISNINSLGLSVLFSEQYFYVFYWALIFATRAQKSEPNEI